MINNELDLLSIGYNPITKQFEVAEDFLTEETPFIQALEIAKKKIKVADTTMPNVTDTIKLVTMAARKTGLCVVSIEVHDIHFLKDIREQMSDCTLIGDKGYLSAEVQIDLFNYTHIQADTPTLTNQKDYKPQFSLFKKKRKRMETLFSQLCDQFMIKRNYAKSFGGFKTRIISKIAATTVIQYINNLKVSII